MPIREDSGMFFKDKGKIYKEGDIATFTLIQGVSATVLPEIEFKNGFFDFEHEANTDFSFPVNELKWIDVNKGLGTDESPLSTGGVVTYVKMNDANEVLPVITVGEYSTDEGRITRGDLTYTGGGTSSIPANQLTVGRNVFKFTITNKIKRNGITTNTSNVYIVTIDVKQTTEVVFKDIHGNTLTPPAGYTTSFTGKVGEPLVILYPSMIGTYLFQDTSPALVPYTVVGNDIRTSSVFVADQNLITANYLNQNVDVTIIFRHQGDSNSKIYLDADAIPYPTYVADFTEDVEPGTSIETWVQQMITAGKIRLNFTGYNPVNINEYKVEAMAIKPTTIPDQDITIVYEYTGVLSTLE